MTLPRPRVALSALTPALVGSGAAAPSFNCAKAATPVEKAICANAALAGQDAAIAQQYKAVRDKLDAEAAKSLTADQRCFLSVPFCGMNGSLYGDWFAVR